MNFTKVFSVFLTIILRLNGVRGYMNLYLTGTEVQKILGKFSYNPFYCIFKDIVLKMGFSVMNQNKFRFHKHNTKRGLLIIVIQLIDLIKIQYALTLKVFTLFLVIEI